jgi:hypothetical protein
MIILTISGGIIVAAFAGAAVYDYRARRRGWRVSPSTEEAFQNRMDVKAIDNPFLQGGKQDWMTWRKRD